MFILCSYKLCLIKYVIIAEVQDPECNSVKDTKYEEKYSKVRKELEDRTTDKRNKKHKRYRYVEEGLYIIKGVVFKDKKHVVNEAAPGVLEIHPIIELIHLN